METELFRCLVPDSKGRRVLLVETGQSWSVPAVEAQRGWFPQRVGQISSALRERFHLNAIAVRQLEPHELELGEFELVEADQTPAEGQWIACERLPALRFTSEVEGCAVREWVASRSVSPLAVRPPWERRGWFAQVRAWIEDQLAAQGLAGVGCFHPIHGAWGWSFVMRVPTTGGDLYFKATYARPPSELDVLLELSRHWPANVPEVIAHDRERRWMLMRDFGAGLLDGASIIDCESAVAHFAEMQVRATVELDRWWKLGCPDRRPAVLPEYLNDFLSDARRHAESGSPHVKKSQLDRTPEALASFQKACAELARSEVPPSFVQQDFRHGNVAVRNGHFIFFDWSDCVIGHPFFSIARLLAWLDTNDFPDAGWTGAAKCKEAILHRLRDAYLTPWRQYAPVPRLIEIFNLVMRLNAAYMPLRWYLEWPHLEPSSPWGKTVTQLALGDVGSLVAAFAE